MKIICIKAPKFLVPFLKLFKKKNGQECEEVETK